MSRVPHSHMPYGALGEGVYGKARAEQVLANMRNFQPLILQAVEKIPLGEGDSVFGLGDYGCNDGACSMELIAAIIRAVRRRAGREVGVQVVYEDQPTNDFISLFKRLHGLIPDPPSYLAELKQVYVTASGTDFFQPIMPPASMNLILSFGSAHYLSKPGPVYQDSFHRFPNASAEERQIVEAQAAKDWETFLLLRARELKKGGVLFVAMPGYDPEGKKEGVRHCVEGMEVTMLAVWRAMRDEGIITQEEYVNTNLHRCPKTLEECRAPFLQAGGSVTKAGLELLASDLSLMPCVITAAWKDRRDADKAKTKEWSEKLVDNHRVWTYPTLRRVLAEERPASQKEAVMQELFGRMQAEVERQGPDTFLNQYLSVYVLARKL